VAQVGDAGHWVAKSDSAFPALQFDMRFWSANAAKQAGLEKRIGKRSHEIIYKIRKNMRNLFKYGIMVIE